MKKQLGFVLSPLLLATACSQPQPANSALTVGTSQEPPNINDPWSTNNLAIAAEINGMTSASLTYRDNDGEMHPDIAPPKSPPPRTACTVKSRTPAAP